MSETTAKPEIDLDTIEKVMKIVNLQVDTELKAIQQRVIPWQFIVTVIGIAFGMGATITAGIFTLVKWKLGG